MEKIALITGASRGIGAATARLAAKHGWAVAVNYLANEAAAQGVVDAIRADGGTAIAVQGDVASEADILALFQTVDTQLGRISALVNNAGVVDVTARVDAMSTERLRRMFDTNVIGSIVCAREAVRRMSTRHGGSGGAIVNVSSAASRLGSAHQYVDYAAAKGIKREEIAAIGDNLNDESMIQAAGTGVAMGNAIPQIKTIASFVTKSNNEDGVAWAIDKILADNQKEQDQ